MSDDGAVFYIKPRVGCTVTAREVHALLVEQFPGTGLGLTGTSGDEHPTVFPDGTYEVRTFGPAGERGLGMALSYCYWEVIREVPWKEWEVAQR